MKIEFKHDLSTRNTFRMNVSCECFVEYDSVKELASINFDALPKPFLHIGGGSNLLFTGDFPGTVFHSRINYLKYFDMGMDDVPVAVGAGVNFDRFVGKVCEHGLWGVENLSNIPGEVGAAAVQNIGAYGVEFKDVVSGISCFDLQEHKRVSFKPEECGYGYRHSMFKSPEFKGRYIVTGVLFRLSRVPVPRLDYRGLREKLEAMGCCDPENLTPEQVRNAVIAIRRDKLPDPDEIGSAGSFFKNPVIPAEEFARVSPDGNAPHFLLGDGSVKVPAAWLIDSCGLKGKVIGGAAVYDRQPLVIVNHSGEALPTDILTLEKLIIDTVKERFGIELHPEVEHV